MNQAIKDKLSKVYELINRGSTDGEKEAARAALERLMAKYNIKEEQLANIDINRYVFKYQSQNEMCLLAVIKTLMLTGRKATRRIYAMDAATGDVCRVKEIIIDCTYQEYIQIECAYEYFRRHMKRQYQLHIIPAIKNIGGQRKTKAARVKKLKEAFMSEYLIKSKLYRQTDLVRTKLTKTDMKDFAVLNNIKGGTLTTQINNQPKALLT